jgi:hypothetical protein
MTGKSGVPQSGGLLDDGTIKLEEQYLQQTVAQHYLKLRVRTQKFTSYELNQRLSQNYRGLISVEKSASTFVVLPRHGALGSHHWLIELLFLDPDMPPFGIELANDIVLGVTRYGSGKPDLDLRSFGGNEEGMSRRHAILHPGNEALILMDLGSVNGTWISGERLDPNVPVSITKSSIISLGTLTFAVRIVSTPADLGL